MRKLIIVGLITFFVPIWVSAQKAFKIGLKVYL